LYSLQGTREEWLVVFYIGAAAYAFGAVFFLIFGSGDAQPWANYGATPSDKEKQHATCSHPDGVSPDDLAEAILAAAGRKSAEGVENIQMRALGESAEVGVAEGAAVASGDTVHRRASRSHLKPMVPCADEEDEKGW
jgi:hypothetical protein